MEVSIQSQSTVLPSKPTPNPKLFSLCEQIKLPTHVPLLCVYNSQKHKNTSTLFETLRNSLSQVLVIYYPLVGRLNWIKGGRWELNCSAKGALLLEAKCETNLKDLGDFVPNNLLSQFIPKINYNLPMEDIPLLAVQLTSFQCGGFTLGIALCRAVMDGTANTCFMNTWAKLARGESLNEIELPYHDRTLLNSRKLKNSPMFFRHHEFEESPVWTGSELGDTGEVSVAIVKLTREQIFKLKKKVDSLVSFQPTSKDVCASKPYSTFEVVAGHLWRCVSKARYIGNNDQPTRLSTLVDSRNRLKPLLPIRYAGNAAFPTVTSTRSFNDVISRPLGNVVEDVRKAVERVTGEYVMSVLGYIDRENDMNLLRYNIFQYPTKSVHEGKFLRNPNLFVVSWMNFSHKGVDFGWGGPDYFGPGHMDSKGKAFVMNNGYGDGIVVAISLEASCMDNFNKFFYGDIDEFCASKL